MGEYLMKALLLRGLALISGFYVLGYVLSLDSLTVRQMLIGALGCVIPVLYLMAYIYANYDL